MKEGLIGGLVFDSLGVVGRDHVSNKAYKRIRFVVYIGLVFESFKMDVCLINIIRISFLFSGEAS